MSSNDASQASGANQTLRSAADRAQVPEMTQAGGIFRLIFTTSGANQNASDPRR